MKSHIAILFAFIFPLAWMQGQSISPLEQVMTTTSLISRPLVFRNMQASIDTELGNQKPGLQIEGMHEAVGEIREQLLDILQQPVVRYDSINSLIHISFWSWEDSVKVPRGTALDLIWKEMKVQLNSNIKKELDRVLDTMKKPNIKAALVDVTIQMIRKSDLAAGIDLDKFDEKYGTDKLATIIVEIATYRIQQKIGRLLAIQEIPGKADIPLMCKIINDEIGDICIRIRMELVSIFNHGEYELSRTIDETSRKLFAANTGIGITKGKGSFNGGLYLSIISQQQFQLGIYVNGELSKADSTQPTESLTGIHLRYATDNMQIDFLGASLFGDNNFKTFTIAEAGFGVTIRTNSDLLIGGAVYALGQTLSSTQLTAGFIFQSAQVGSASVFIGLQGRGGDYHPVMQVSFPIVPSLN